MATFFDSGAERGLSFLQGCGARVLVHGFALALVVFTIVGAPSGGGIFWALAAYVGVVCLFGRFLFRPFGGYAPLIAGVVQIGVVLALGGGFFPALFLGGLQAWIGQAILGKMIFRAYPGDQSLALGEWITLGAFVLLCLRFLVTGEASLILFSTVPVIALAAALLIWPFSVHRAKRISRETVNRIGALATSRDAPPQSPSQTRPQMLEAPLRKFFGLANALLNTPTVASLTRIFPFARAVRPLEERLTELRMSVDPNDSLVRTERLFSEIKAMNAALERQVPAARPPAPPSIAAQVSTRAAFDEGPFRADIQALQNARNVALPVFWPAIDAICRSAENILEAMRDDPADVAEGSRFLRRYLKAARDILDEYARLAPGLSRAGAGAEATDRTIGLLQRLESAFAAEHALLLKNDHLAFVADLNTLDRLLDMEAGRDQR